MVLENERVTKIGIIFFLHSCLFLGADKFGLEGLLGGGRLLQPSSFFALGPFYVTAVRMAEKEARLDCVLSRRV